MRNNFKRLIKIVENFENKKIGVIGDLALDRFWFGEVDRISREAPVPIVKLLMSEEAPGCAANCLSNISALNGKAIAMGVLGNDRDGEILLSILKSQKVETKYILRTKNYTTPTKTRILAGHLHGPKQQLVRVDKGNRLKLDKKLKEKITKNLITVSKETDYLVISDYGYGLLEDEEIREGIKYFKVTAVDSRFDLLKFKGAITATPNEEEFEFALKKRVLDSHYEFEKEGEKLRKKLNMEALLVTRGRKGMTLFEKNEKPYHIDIVGKEEVVDVTGAGDTVIASFILSLASGANFKEAAHIANIAGGIVVTKPKTATCNREELIKRITMWGKGEI